MRRGRKPQKKSSIWKGKVRKLFIWLAALVVSFYLVCAGLLFLLRFVDPPTTAVQVQRRAEALWSNRHYLKRHKFVPLDRISPNLRHAVISAEDGRFYEHFGVDFQELQKVVEENLERRKRWRGGSTITQQLVKNLFLITASSVLRKGLDFTLAPLCELFLSKDRILELYLNVIEWGDGIYGIEAASQFYFQVPASALNRDQSARLAACLPAPRRRHPLRMDGYSAQILKRMESRGW